MNELSVAQKNIFMILQKGYENFERLKILLIMYTATLREQALILANETESS